MAIKSVTGKCDGVDIIFKHVKNNQWVCDVPTDYTDGAYVVELFAEDEAGKIGYYTGILYLCNSKFVKLDINKSDIRLTFYAETNCITFKEKFTLNIVPDSLRVEFSSTKVVVK